MHDFRLTISSEPDDAAYRVTLSRRPGEEELAATILSNLDAAALLDESSQLLDAFPQETPAGEHLQAFGKRLAGVLLPPQIRRALLAQLRTSADPTTPVRLRLKVTAPELDRLPWEFAFVEAAPPVIELSDFLCLHPRFHLVRQGGEAGSQETIPADTLRVLIAWADPASARYPRLLQLQEEVNAIEAALRSSECRRIEVEVLPSATRAGLQRLVSERHPHIMHFLGHGDVAPTGGLLILESGRSGSDDRVYGQELAEWLREAGVRLVVLSACHSASPVGGVAQALSSAGIAVVVGMQLPMQVATSAQFVRAFYGSLAQPVSVEAALNQARQLLRHAGADWGVPVLYLAADSSELFVPPHFGRDPQHNLPVEDRPFIGRRAESEALLHLLREPGVQLVTITGMGGVGKTRLAKHVAAELTTDFEDGVWFVDLEAITDREGLIAALCNLFGVRFLGNEPERVLRSTLAQKEALLVLDCFERLKECADLIELLLSGAARLKCLITSRKALALDRQNEFPLSPMAIPESDESLDGLQSVESVVLFAEAAGRVKRNFTITAGNRETVQEICRRLEGLPLSLILTASWLRLLSLRELLEQIKKSRSETIRIPGRSDRHASLQQVVADSIALLPAQGQHILRQLAVFEAGFLLEDAEYVCAGTGSTPFLDELEPLCLCSLVWTQSVEGDRTRYRILDSVRECLRGEELSVEAQELLIDCRMRHARRYADLAQSMVGLIRQGKWHEGKAGLSRELGNLQAAVTFSLQMQAVALLADLADGLALYYQEVGLWTQFETLAAAGEVALGRVGRYDALARLYGIWGAFADRRGDIARARRLWQRRLALCRRLRDRPSYADALLDLAMQARKLGDLAEAKRLTSHALRIANRLSEPRLLAYAKMRQAEVALDEGELDSAKEQAEQAYQLLVNPNKQDQRAVIMVCSTLAQVYVRMNADADAERVLRMVVRIAQEEERAYALGRALLELGGVCERQQQLPDAVYAYYAADLINTQLGSRFQEEARAALMRFEQTATPDILALLENARKQKIQQIVAHLVR